MSLQSLLGIDLPVIQAPMAGSQDHALAVAASNAGGLGSLPCAMLGADALRTELAAIKAQTDLPYNLNFFCHATPVSDPVREARWRAVLEPYYRAFDLDPGQLTASPARLPFDAPTAELLEEFKPPVVSFHFGLPQAEKIAALKAAGCTVVLITHRTSIISSVDKILLLRDGQVAAFGPRDEVINALAQAARGNVPSVAAA